LHFEPVHPRKLLIMGIALPLGIVLGLALSLLQEYFDDTVRGRRDVIEIEGLNYLGAVGVGSPALKHHAAAG